MTTRLIQRLRRYRFDWRLSLLTAILLPLMVSLGFWQIRRGDEKTQLQVTYDARQREPAVTLASLDANADLEYRQVKFNGRYDNDHAFLLDNRLYQGQPGYEVIVPVIAGDEHIVLVNRGWIAQGPSRTELPIIAPVPGDVTITGSVYQAVGKTLVLGATQETTGWPRVVEALDIAQLAAMAGYTDAAKVFPHSVRLADAAPGVLVRYWPVVSMTPERHYGYAVQWFLMATALVVLYLFYSTRTETTDLSMKGNKQ
ncbi:MAG TPA: SURF1 family protein [Candidatus Acidoferrum sp.]|nr:SURF1 family protein [Candidatus Acidoferrum sp.]